MPNPSQLKDQLKVFDFLNGSGEYWIKHGFKLVNRLEDADILCLNGGADIGTEIYGEIPVGSSNWDSPRFRSRRDDAEIAMYHEAREMDKFIFGICRGAQLITCLEGGSLWQHVNKHYGDHPIKDVFTGKSYSATSIHHQMMRPPSDKEHQIIAVANRSSLKISQHEKWIQSDEDELSDPEIVWYPDCRALCVQGHPEYAVRSEFADYCTQLIRHLWSSPMWPPHTSTTSVAV